MTDPRVIPLPPVSAGVAYADPGVIAGSIKAQVSAALAEIPPDKRAAIVAVATEKGWNAAVAARVGPHMQVVAWMGKSGWDRPLLDGVAKGVYVKGAW